jgi:hypothetical protein
VGDRKLQFSRDQGVGIERSCEITYQQLERRVAGADAPREGRAKIGELAASPALQVSNTWLKTKVASLQSW